ncbi:MAG TPA: hypothetical protein VMC83_39805 [Streptosporangiaceae bacterium]|nr:hypothetical protein [Streptosporangiaceae bacterium]
MLLTYAWKAGRFSIGGHGCSRYRAAILADRRSLAARPSARATATIKRSWSERVAARSIELTKTARPGRRNDVTLVPLAGLPPVQVGLIWHTAQENVRIRAFAAAARSTRGVDRDRL